MLGAASVALDRAAARRRAATPASTSSSSIAAARLPRGRRWRSAGDAGRRDRRARAHARRRRGAHQRPAVLRRCRGSSSCGCCASCGIGRDRAEALVVELEESRAAQVQAAALAERGRLARDMHDVLAHSLSALALQLEGARLLAARPRRRPRGRRARSSARTTSRAAGSRRRAPRSARCAATRCPGRSACARSPTASATAARADRHGRAAAARLRGAPRRSTAPRRRRSPTSRRHSDADRVELRLAYEPGGDAARRRGPGRRRPGRRPARAPAPATGITGMRERAELLGGRLDAGPTARGFRVELWLPA